MSEETKTINANPTKRFFIEMLVRDIQLEPARTELIDNSLDGAKSVLKQHPEASFQIDVNFNEDSFIIKDNCGGISISDAQNYCFRFGRDDSRAPILEDGTGIFGIGMKRTLFRLGKVFKIHSVTPTEHFDIAIDVDEWIKDADNWTFEFSETNTNENNKIENCGTTIEISNLHQQIKNTFSDPYFNKTFYEYIKERSADLNKLNVQLSVNKIAVSYEDERILFNDSFKPYVKSIELDDVKIKIIAGTAKMGTPKKAGWYVQCNGRTVLYANHGEETGWGTDDISSFHNLYATFRGYVFFESSNLERLPWNTSKTGVDLSSKYYHLALEIMKDCERIYIKWRKQLAEFLNDNENIEAKSVFVGSEEGIHSIKLESYASNDNQYVFPELSSECFPVPEEPETLIKFKETKKKVELVKNSMGSSRISNKEMGEKLFDFYYEREVDENE